MRKYFFLTILILFTFYVKAQQQNSISGVILNKEDLTPVVYATVFVTTRHSGTITNTDGTFFIKDADPNKSVEIKIRHIGFDNITIAFDPVTMDTILLTPVSYDIEGAVITADKIDEHDAAKELLIEITRKYYSQADEGTAKGYFSLQSMQNDSPYEMLEAYYNEEKSGFSVNKLTQKCGRAGIAGYGHSIISTNLTNIYINNKLFSSEGNDKFYGHLFSGSFLKNVKKYNLSFEKSFISDGKEYSIIAFKNKRSGLLLFEGTITVNRSDMIINEIRMHLSDPKSTHIFPINPGDKTGNLEVEVLYLFEDIVVDGYTPLKLTTVDMSYEYFVPNRGVTYVDNSSMLYLFDREEGFLEPVGLPKDLDNDYQAILFTPFSQHFWDYYQRIPRNNEQQRFDKFFRSHGKLINYSGLTQENIYLGNRFFNWSERDKPDISLIEKPLRSHDLQRGIIVENHREQRRDSKVYLDYYIPLFLNRIGSQTEVTAGLIFDSKTSRYQQQKDEFSNLFFHTMLNYLEMERRKLSKDLQAMSTEDPEAIITVYYERLQLIKAGLDELCNTTINGTDHNTLVKRAAEIEKAL